MPTIGTMGRSPVTFAMSRPKSGTDFMGIEVFAADEQTDAPVDTARWVELAERVLEAEKVPEEAELSILYVDESTMADLNHRFTGRLGPTDVLAFPLGDDPVEPGRSPDSGGSGPRTALPEPSELPVLLGDVVICPVVAQRNASDHAVTYEDEMALLLVHGILHLMGMDHEIDEEAEEMERRQRELLDRFYPPDTG